MNFRLIWDNQAEHLIINQLIENVEELMNKYCKTMTNYSQIKNLTNIGWVLIWLIISCDDQYLDTEIVIILFKFV